MCQSLFFNKFAGLRPAINYRYNYRYINYRYEIRQNCFQHQKSHCCDYVPLYNTILHHKHIPQAMLVGNKRNPYQSLLGLQLQ